MRTVRMSKSIGSNILSQSRSTISCRPGKKGEHEHEHEWDDLAFIDICRLREEGALTEAECEEVADLQRAELLFLLQIELQNAMPA